MFRLLIDNLILISGLMSIMWLVSLWLRDASIVDPFWGIGFVVVAVTNLLRTVPSAPPSVWILVGMVLIWGLRLSIYLARRNFQHAGAGQREDRRYAAMRAYHGSRFWIVSLFTVFWLQAVIMWFVSLPIQVAIHQQSLRADTLSTAQPSLILVGVLLWCVGLFFETVGDWQLARFRAEPANAGQVCDCGLWRYTRHPNYFGDFCVWWGLYLVAGTMGAWWTIVSPLLMSFLLLRVSGVTLLESTIAERRPAYRDYIARTNAFFPGPRRT